MYSESVRHGHAYWWDRAPLPEAGGPASLPARVDAVVIGSGFTGLAAALYLARGGQDVVVLEADRLGDGASTRNGGVIGSRFKLSFSRLVATHGLDTACAVYGVARRAYEFTVGLIRDEAIECELEERGRFMGARFAKDYDSMGRDADAMARHLGIDTELIPRADQHREVQTDVYHGGALRTLFAGVHPGLFHAGLMARARSAGVSLLDRTTATGIQPGGRFRVTTTRGTLEADAVIVATNGYTGPMVPYLQRRVIPIRSQILVSEPLGKRLDELLPTRRLMGDTSRLHHYFRPTPGDDRLLFGGRAGAGHLYREMVRIFPVLAGVRMDYSWTGNVAYTFDTMPHMGVVDGVHYALGYCGSGVAMGPYMGAQVARMVLGEDPGRGALDDFPFQTRPWYRGRPWFLPFAFFWYGLRDRLGI